MNKIVSISLLILVAQSIAPVTTNKIDKAIEDSSMSNIKSALSRFDREEMTPKMRKKHLQDFARAAAEVIEQREENCSIIGNSHDIAKTSSGIVLALAGLMVAYKNIDFRNKLIKSLPMFGGGLSLLTGSGYFLYKGLTCSTQKDQIAQARSIEKLLKDKLVNARPIGEDSESAPENSISESEGGSQGTTTIDTSKINKAIEDSSMSAVKSALNKFEQEEMTPLMRKKYFKDFAQAAAEITGQREEKLSIVGNGWDIAQTTSGGAFILGGIGGCVGSYYLYNSQYRADRDFALPALNLGIAALISGIRLLYRGITCTTQKYEIAQAQAIEKYLQGKLSETDLEETAG